MSQNFNIEDIKTQLSLLKMRKYVSLKFNIDIQDPSILTNIIAVRCNKAYNPESGIEVVDCNEPITKNDLDKIKGYFLTLLKQVKPDECCYVIYDFGFYNDTGRFKEIICLIGYIPDEANVNFRLAYSYNSLNIKEVLGVGKYIAINNKEELTYDNISKILSHYSKA